ncbi:MAG: endonuclease MutS2 [Clostridium sp.]
MNEKSLRVLEFNKIKEVLKKYVHTMAAKDIVSELKPYDNIYEVKEHLEETDEALRLIMKKGAAPFEGIYDVREALSRVGKGSTLIPDQLLKIAQILKSSRNFIEYVSHKNEEEGYRVLKDICEGITPLKRIEDKIFNAIIGEDELSDRASDKLYLLRKSLKEKSGSIKEKINSLVRANSAYLQESLYTIRGDRYVIPVKAEYKGAVPGLVHDQSSSGATLFIEPMGLVNLNNEIKEIKLKEKAEIERILAELSREIYQNIKQVDTNAKIIWELDFIFGKAKYASEINAIKPIVNNEGIIDVVEARHPLINRETVVANDFYLGNDFNSLVITGPNTGGKTVTIKTIGLIQLMALSGLLIPARDNSVVAFFKDVFADIGDEQSIEQNLSTFSSHMTNIVNIIENADETSLAIFDELGAGTDPTEGAALAISILENLRGRNCRIVATTHYSELKGYALKTVGVENASVEFDVKTLRPTYRLLIGVPGKSNAFEISKRLGLPEYIIESAKGNISEDTLEFENLIQTLQDKNIVAERNARESQLLKNEVQKLKLSYDEKLDKLKNTREKIMQEAQVEAKRLLKNTKEEVDEIIKSVKKLENEGYSSSRQKLDEQRSKIKGKINSIEELSSIKEGNKGIKLVNVTPGMEVLFITLNQKVTVLSDIDKKGEVQVQAGIMKISVKLENLRAIEPGKQSKEERKYAKKELKLRMANISTSVDLRGMDSEEAIYATDKYLDEAYMGGLGEVTVIHGKGTGVLRKSITDMLRRHPHVKTSRIGSYAEGGTGVTVVELKV